MDQAIRSVDECREIMRTGDWVCKESAANDPNFPKCWRIDCASGSHSFSIFSAQRGEAWNQAVSGPSRPLINANRRGQVVATDSLFGAVAPVSILAGGRKNFRNVRHKIARIAIAI